MENNTSELKEKVVSISRVAKVVKGGRTFRFSAVVVVGDGAGHVGVGNGNPNDMDHEALYDEVEYIEIHSFNSNDETYFQPHKTENNLSPRRDFTYFEQPVDGFEDDFRIVAAFSTQPNIKEERIYKTSFVGEYDFIEFERIDSDAEIFLNGEKIGDNHTSYRVKGDHVRPYRFPIKSESEKNELLIKAVLSEWTNIPFSGYVRAIRKNATKYEVNLYCGKARVFYHGRNAKIIAKISR